MATKKTSKKAKPASKRAVKPASATEPNKGGRPSSYDPKFCKQAYQLCLLGATDKQLADFFEISVATLYNWKNEYPEFSDALKRGKLPSDGKVADCLFRRATGYRHKETKFFVVAQGNGMGSAIEEKETVKVYPPDTIAAIFWLKNRQPEMWRDKVEQDITSKGESIAPPMSDKQFREIVKLLNAPDKGATG